MVKIIIKSWFYEEFVIFQRCDFMDFTITRTKSNFWGGSIMSTPPKHTILSMVSYLQELKTIILEKSVPSVIAFFKIWGCLYENARFWKKWGCLCENARFWQNVKKNPSSWSDSLENLYLGALGAIGMCRGGHVI